VAVRAGRTLVGYPEVGMVKYRPQPSGGHPGGVARDASCRIRGGDVIRHVRAIRLRIRVVRLMAAVAIGGRIASRVVPSDVAVRACINHWADRARHRRARRQHMRTLQREARRAMVKFSIHPRHRVVAARAHGCREICRDVVWHVSAKRLCAGPRRLMAAVTIRVRARERVVVVDMAVRTEVHLAGWRQLMRTRQRPACRAVIEDRRCPGDGVVARRAVRRGKRRSSA